MAFWTVVRHRMSQLLQRIQDMLTWNKCQFIFIPTTNCRLTGCSRRFGAMDNVCYQCMVSSQDGFSEGKLKKCIYHDVATKAVAHSIVRILLKVYDCDGKVNLAVWGGVGVAWISEHEFYQAKVLTHMTSMDSNFRSGSDHAELFLVKPSLHLCQDSWCTPQNRILFFIDTS